ncbi:hypothetical protein GRX03_15455 [Halovenus sp. WSH3]|uniref:Uncharacterized protein n=1 Tax=Halovenus carboxidivorans TaxID=2692199 RepID=A0A6B0T4F5_9EURY|nr:hypothetical protein [Halovenus carboxidivorans]MXR52995.1 hypothetical protein [Halovenus carboxidivorans]
MARKLAHSGEERPDSNSGENDQLTRRTYLKLGAVASGAALVSGSGFAGTTAGSQDGTVLTTDFSEYAQ